TLAIIVSDDDLRDDVGFLGSLPLTPRTESKPVTPSVSNRTSVTLSRGDRMPVSTAGAPVDRAGLDPVVGRSPDPEGERRVVARLEGSVVGRGECDCTSGYTGSGLAGGTGVP